MGNRNRPIIKTIVGQDGASFTAAVSALDSLARPTTATESSSLGFSRSTSVTFADNPGLWVLGAPSAEGVSGLLVSQYAYDALVRPIRVWSFGKLLVTRTYNPDGTLSSVADGNNRVVSFLNWYRGLPRNIIFADGTSESASVNGAGWITDVTTESGATTSYSYDAMGRLAGITYPAGDDVAWNQTLLSFTQVNSSEYGIPAGHWKQVIRTGNGVVTTYFDAMWRPLVSERYDAGNRNATLTQSISRYDAEGRQVFASYPTNSVSRYTQSLPGTYTSYDALNRVSQVQQDSELGRLTMSAQYLAGFQTRLTNPRGFSTVTAYQAFGEPSTQSPVSITAPEGQLTLISRDVFGKPLSIARTGTAAGAPRLTRYYVYDGNQELCKQIDLETGATAYGYDGAGNLVWSAAGLSQPDASARDADAAYASGRRVDRVYDARNRLLTLAFPDGVGNQAWGYLADGMPNQATTTSQDGAKIVTAYTYNKRRLLTNETLSQPGGYTWSVGYAYDANGQLDSMTYPNGTSVGFAPNALGQATRVGVPTPRAHNTARMAH